MSAPVIDVDLFAGPGGWDEAVKHLGISPWGFEWGDAQCQTGRAAGHRRVQGDIAEMDPRSVLLGAIVRLMIGSPPCQGFSMAGSGKGRQDAELLIKSIRLMTPANIDAAIAWLKEHMKDPRSILVLEPLRWAMFLNPTYIALEQVPGVLPIWEAMAEVLRKAGYSVATGVINAEQYGVPQTRKRAILVARGDGKEARLPVPTHSRYYPRTPERLDEGVAKWVSMAEALGWGGAVLRSNYGTGGDPKNRGERTSDEPAPTITSKAGRNKWTVKTGNFTAVARDADGGRSKAGSVPYERPIDAPAPTVTGTAARWEAGPPLAMGDVVRANGTVRDVEQPAPTLTGSMDNGNFRWIEAVREAVIAEVAPRVNNQSGTEFDLAWPLDRPSPVIAGRDIVTMPGANANRFNGATKSRNDGVRVTVEEAAILQSFPADYPWQGNKGEQFQQVGDAVPPLLAYAIIKEIMS